MSGDKNITLLCIIKSGFLFFYQDTPSSTNLFLNWRYGVTNLHNSREVSCVLHKFLLNCGSRMLCYWLAGHLKAIFVKLKLVLRILDYVVLLVYVIFNEASIRLFREGILSPRWSFSHILTAPTASPLSLFLSVSLPPSQVLLICCVPFSPSFPCPVLFLLSLLSGPHSLSFPHFFFPPFILPPLPIFLLFSPCLPVTPYLSKVFKEKCSSHFG